VSKEVCKDGVGRKEPFRDANSQHGPTHAPKATSRPFQAKGLVQPLELEMKAKGKNENSLSL